MCSAFSRAVSHAFCSIAGVAFQIHSKFSSISIDKIQMIIELNLKQGICAHSINEQITYFEAEVIRIHFVFDLQYSLDC